MSSWLSKNSVTRRHELKRFTFQNLSEATKQQYDMRLWTEWLALYAQRLEKEVPEDAAKDDIETINRSKKTLMDSLNPR